MVEERPGSPAFLEGQLQIQPTAPRQTLPPKLHPLGLRQQRDGFLYIPAHGLRHPAPLMLMLHGAGGDARQGLAMMRQLSDEFGVILLSVDSCHTTWDVIQSNYGPDIAFINRALEYTFDHCEIAPAQLAICGFSDGASYALSVGLTNGNLFSHTIAFSPGFIAARKFAGYPQIFVSHGIHDRVLPIDRCSRAIVPRLKQERYSVLYQEFDGGHIVPPGITREAIAWFLQPSAAKK